MPVRTTQVRAHHRHNPQSPRVTKVHAYQRHQEVRGPQVFLEEFIGPKQVKLDLRPELEERCAICNMPIAPGQGKEILRGPYEGGMKCPSCRASPTLDKDHEELPFEGMQCRKYPGSACMGEACQQWSTCRPQSWDPKDPRRKETEAIQAAARARGEITEQEQDRLEVLADDLIADYLAEKKWNSDTDITFREWWLGPMGGVPDRTWAHKSWADLPSDVKARLMKTYNLAEEY